MKKKLLKFLGILGVALLAGGWLVIPTAAGSARDCDNNAVIYCGAYSTTELAKKINNGTQGPHQSASELKALFAKYDIYTSDFGNLKNGRVTKDNKVYVDGKSSPVATNVYSMGRHKTANSKDVPGISYPLWLRHPSESFLSNSIDAYVYINYDGSMAYAIIKSCGNIVPGVGKRVKPAPKFNLTVRKFNDLNSDKKKQSNESYLSGWTFKVTGNGINKNVTTGKDGSVTLPDLKPGTYTVEEIQQSGWVSTTGLKQTVKLDANKTVIFGNAKVQAQTVAIRIIKFNDINGNKNQESNEQKLSGWEFKVSGNGINQTLKTGANGEVSLSNLKPGTYTVTEINQTGWTNTTGLTVTRNVTTDLATQTFIFGNRKITTPPETPETPVTPEVETSAPLPVSGPTETAAAAFSLTSITGGAMAWVRSRRRLLESLKK